MDKKKLLLIEDDQFQARFFKQLFSAEGYEVELAENVENGFIQGLQFNPDLILTDYWIGGEAAGLKFCSMARGNAALKDKIIIIITACELSDELDNVSSQFHDLPDGWINKNEGSDAVLTQVNKWVKMI